MPESRKRSRGFEPISFASAILASPATISCFLTPLSAFLNINQNELTPRYFLSTNAVMINSGQRGLAAFFEKRP